MHYFANKHQNTQYIYKSCPNSILMYNNVNINLIQALIKIGGYINLLVTIIQYNTGLLSNMLSLL